MPAIVLKKLKEEEIIDEYVHYVDEDNEFQPREPKADETQIKVNAVALNHRDIWLLMGALFKYTYGGVLCSDGVGTVLKSNKYEEGTRLLPNPGDGWISDKDRPEGEFNIIGLPPAEGTMSPTYTRNSDDFAVCPAHLTDEQAAALPLAGLTAFRALFTKCEVPKDLKDNETPKNILITGIGGGVALFALQFAVKAGANVYVTSSSEEKINKAIKYGAKGGVLYRRDDVYEADKTKEENLEILKEAVLQDFKTKLNGELLDAVIDGASGPMVDVYFKVMKKWANFASYGQTTGDPIANVFDMNHVLSHTDMDLHDAEVHLRGSTMGSRREFHEMVEFVNTHKVKPIVSEKFYGFTKETMNEALSLMKSGKQFGKIVIFNKNNSA